MSDDKQWDDDNNDNDYYYVSNEDNYDVFHLKSLGFETIHLGNLLAQFFELFPSFAAAYICIYQ